MGGRSRSKAGSSVGCHRLQRSDRHVPLSLTVVSFTGPGNRFVAGHAQTAAQLKD